MHLSQKKLKIFVKILMFQIIFITYTTNTYATLKNNDKTTIEISEIRFNEKQHDWIELSIKNNEENNIILKIDNHEITIDKSKTPNKKFILISLGWNKESSEQKNDSLIIKSKIPNLTSTTEQVILKKDKKIIDIACWQNKKNPKTEMEEIKKLKNELKNTNIKMECINSTTIKKQDSISKIKGIWQKTIPTPNKTNKLKTEGQTSKHIKINEIYPNPKGKDGKKEWVELYNESTKNVNLEMWTINNKEIKNTTIYGKGTTIISTTGLKNNKGTITLKDSEGKIIDTISYKTTSEGKSYSKTNTKSINRKKTLWLWTKSSKNKPNQTFYIIDGIIEKEPEITTEYSFKLKETKTNNTTTIYFDPKNFTFTLIKNLLSINTKVEILTQKENGKLKMINYHIINKTENPKKQVKTNNNIYYITGTITLLLIIIQQIISSQDQQEHCKQVQQHLPYSYDNEVKKTKNP